MSGHRIAEPELQETPQLSAAALSEWGRHVENVVRGIAHALNNRAAALSAVAELTADPDDDPSVSRAILAGELGRMRDLAEVIRSIGTPRSGVEAFSPRDAAVEALAVLKLHAEQQDHTIMIDASAAPPTRVRRWMFVRSLIALAAGASDAADKASSVRIAVVEEDGWIVARAEGVAPGEGQRSPYMSELASAMGGEILVNQHGFRVPTLATLRQREDR